MEEDEVAGFFVFSHIQIRCHLGLVRLGSMSATQDLKIIPAGLKPPTGTRKRRKATVKSEETRYFALFH